MPNAELDAAVDEIDHLLGRAIKHSVHGRSLFALPAWCIEKNQLGIRLGA